MKAKRKRVIPIPKAKVKVEMHIYPKGTVPERFKNKDPEEDANGVVVFTFEGDRGGVEFTVETPTGRSEARHLIPGDTFFVRFFAP